MGSLQTIPARRGRATRLAKGQSVKIVNTHYHDNCRDNMHAGLAELGLMVPYCPPSLNTFMNIPWRQDGALEWGNCLCRKGDHVVFRAEMDAIVVFSACPQDLLPINNGVTTEAHFEVLD